METIRFVHTDLAKRLLLVAGAADSGHCEHCTSESIIAVMGQFPEVDWEALHAVKEAWEWETPYGSMEGYKVREILGDILGLDTPLPPLRAVR